VQDESLERVNNTIFWLARIEKRH